MTTDFSNDQHPPGSQSAAAEINPYAPSLVQPDTAETNVSVAGFGHVSTLLFIVNTMAGVTFSGGLFAMGTLIVGDSPPAILIGGVILGCFLAFLGSLAIVPLAAAGSLLIRVPGVPWTASSIRIFGALAGFLTGYLWIPFLSGFTAWSMAIGFIPGIVGAIGTTIALIPLARRATRAWERISEIDDGPPSLADDRASNVYRP